MNKYKTKNLILVGIAGFIGSLFFLLGPLHEFWHILFSLLHGYVPEIHWSYVSSADYSISMTLAGPFGELISYGLIYAYAIYKRKIYLAVWMIGYMGLNIIAYTLPITFIGDFEFCLIIYPGKEIFIKTLYWIATVLNYLWVIIAVVGVVELKKDLQGRLVKNTKNSKIVYNKAYTV